MTENHKVGVRVPGGAPMYAFKNRGVELFLYEFTPRKVYKKVKRVYRLPSPARKPKYPVPKFGI